MIRGHVPACHIQYPCKLWTVVRDPIDRLYSLYKFIDEYDTFGAFLDYMEKDPVDFVVKESKNEDARSAELEKRRFYQDNVDRLEGPERYDGESNFDRARLSMDLLSKKWFLDKETAGVKTQPVKRIPGINLRDQWEYIRNDVGHEIEVVKFTDRKRIEELAGKKLTKHINKGGYTPEEKEDELTSTIKSRIQSMCSVDYDNLEF